MTDRHILRIGGISGILFIILFIPSYLSAPDSPSLTSSAQQLLDHLVSRQDEIILLNGVLLVFAAFFFLWFIGVLHSMLQGAERDGYGFASVALTGGLLFVALMLAGAAVEIVLPRPCPASRISSGMHRSDSCRSRCPGGCIALPLSGWRC